MKKNIFNVDFLGLKGNATNPMQWINWIVGGTILWIVVGTTQKLARKAESKIPYVDGSPDSLDRRSSAPAGKAVL